MDTLKLSDFEEGFSFTNLVDFDAVYGHRRNIEGYRDCLQEFDARIPEIIDNMREDDLLLITADHGNDPSYVGTDHTREYVPLWHTARLSKEMVSCQSVTLRIFQPLLLKTLVWRQP